MTQLQKFLDLGIPHSPLLFNGEMVEALIAGRKTQTRRDMGLKEINKNPEHWKLLSLDLIKDEKDSSKYPRAYYLAIFQKKGTKRILEVKLPWKNLPELIWVKETWCLTQPYNPETYHFGYRANSILRHSTQEASDNYDFSSPDVYRPSIHMPKEAARIWLRLTGVRIERLQDVSDDDSVAEGVWIHNDYYGNKGYLNYMYGESKGFRREYFFGDGNYSMEGVPDHTGFQASYFTLVASMFGWDVVVKNPWLWVFEFEVVSTTGLSPVLDLYKSNL